MIFIRYWQGSDSTSRVNYLKFGKKLIGTQRGSYYYEALGIPVLKHCMGDENLLVAATPQLNRTVFSMLINVCDICDIVGDIRSDDAVVK